MNATFPDKSMFARDTCFFKASTQRKFKMKWKNWRKYKYKTLTGAFNTSVQKRRSSPSLCEVYKMPHSQTSVSTLSCLVLLCIAYESLCILLNKFSGNMEKCMCFQTAKKSSTLEKYSLKHSNRKYDTHHRPPHPNTLNYLHNLLESGWIGIWKTSFSVKTMLLLRCF